MEDMATRIRYEITRRHAVDRINMTLAMIPFNGQEKVNALNHIQDITADYLLNFFNNCLRSQENIELNGTRIIITIIGQGMHNARNRGRGRTAGSQHLPSKFKGISCIVCYWCGIAREKHVKPCEYWDEYFYVV
jgi:hypothetical protein